MSSKKDTEIKGKVVSKREEIRDNLKNVQPSLTKLVFDDSTKRRLVTYTKTSHIYQDDKETGGQKYKHTLITEEEFDLRLRNEHNETRERDRLFEIIDEDVNNVNLEKIQSLDDVLEFANETGGSNTEKKRRGIALVKKLRENYENKLDEWLQKKQTSDDKNSNVDNPKPVYTHFRITSSDFSNNYY